MAGSIVGSVIGHRSRGVVKLKADITCSSGGVASATVLGAAYGRLVAVGYKPSTIDTAAVLTLTDTDTGTAIITLTAPGTNPLYFRPTQNVTLNTGVSITAGTGANDVNRDIVLAGKVSLAVTGGGSGTTGGFYLVIDEDAGIKAKGN